MKFHDIGRGHLIEARHRYCMELSSAMAALMLTIQANFDTEELNRAMQEADDAVS